MLKSFHTTRSTDWC